MGKFLLERGRLIQLCQSPILKKKMAEFSSLATHISSGDPQNVSTSYKSRAA